MNNDDILKVLLEEVAWNNKKYVFQNLCPTDGDKEDLGEDEAG